MANITDINAHNDDAFVDAILGTNPLDMVDFAAYARAVATLAEVAQHTTSGGRAAAQVLLSTYNGYEFHIDATDLRLLDPRNLRAAITVLQGQADLHMEPQKCLVDGDQVFERLWKRWEHLSISNALRRAVPGELAVIAAPNCEACDMPGEELEHLEDEGNFYCHVCGHRTPDDLEADDWSADVPY